MYRDAFLLRCICLRNGKQQHVGGDHRIGGATAMQ